MVERRTIGMLLGVALALGCGSERKGPKASAGASGAGGDQNTAAAGSAGTSAAGTAGVGQGGSGEGGAVTGNGELDAACMTRTTNQIGGSRIVLRTAVTAEGDSAFIGFYDAEKQIECRVRQDAEGKFRCLPVADNSDLANRYFLDDACSDEIEYRGNCSLDYQAVPLSADPCDQRRRIYAYGPAIENTMVYRTAEGGACAPYAVLNQLYRRGVELSAADYAEVTPAVWRGKGRLWAEGYEGDGDLRMVMGFRDSELDQPCNFQWLNDGQQHCVPWRQANLLDYADATCSRPILTIPNICDVPSSSYATYTSGDVCKPAKSVATADVPYEGELYSRNSCMPVANRGEPAFIPKPAPDSDFLAVVSSTPPSDAGRLKPIYNTATDGGCSFDTWWDEQLKTRCSFALPGVGEPYYCLPDADATSPAVPLDAYSDADCTHEANYVMLPACEGAKPPLYSVGQAQVCNAGWRTIREVATTPSVPPALWTNRGGICTPYAPSAGASYYATGGVLPANMFVQAIAEP